MPGGSAGQLLTFEQDQVANAGARKVVSHRAADDAAANNDDLSAGRKCVFVIWMPVKDANR